MNCGDGWVVSQVLLVVLWLLTPRLETRWPAPLRVLGAIGGFVAAAIGAGFFIAGLLSLGRNLTPFPRPKADAMIVTGGAYQWVRHPMYAGMTLMLLGLGTVTANLSRVVLGIGTLVFFDRKAALEERWLDERFADYKSYRQQVRWRLLPGLR